MEMKRILLYIVLIICFLIVFLFLIRTFSVIEVDDVSPVNNCPQLLDKVDVLFVIPKFDNVSIADNKIWCNYILSLNKTLALHGVYHSYQEFLTDRNQEYLDEGIKIFEECFNKSPEIFKAPQLAISKNNKILVKNSNLKLENYFNQIIHRVYHCNNWTYEGYIEDKFKELI